MNVCPSGFVKLHSHNKRDNPDLQTAKRPPSKNSPLIRSSSMGHYRVTTSIAIKVYYKTAASPAFLKNGLSQSLWCLLRWTWTLSVDLQGIALSIILTSHPKYLDYRSVAPQISKITHLITVVDCPFQYRERICVWSMASPFRPEVEKQCTGHTAGGNRIDNS